MEVRVSSQYGWIPRKRNYEEDAKNHFINSVLVDSGPLSEAEVNHSDLAKKVTPKEEIYEDIDPLSAAVSDPLAGYDPLLNENPLAETNEPVYDPLSRKYDTEEIQDLVPTTTNEGFAPWSSKKPAILKKYTTNERVSISVSFMENEQTGPVDKVKDRLEELEEAEVEDTVKVSQQEYLKQIETMHNELLDAWNNNQRVQALKIAIQCSKLLSDTTVIKFYPSKFVLITEILDTFGRLVFDRLRGRSTIYNDIDAVPVHLPDDFKAEDVTPLARETCRNWFYKIASIRELLPRLYVEMALLNCYRFLSNDTFPTIVSRIGAMLKGIGNPLVATYARAYLARKGREVGCYKTEYLLSMYYDHIDTYQGLRSDKRNSTTRLATIINASGLETEEYLDLYTPALEWIMQCIGHNANQELLDAVLRKYKECDNSLILDHILYSFKPSFVSPRALDFGGLIKEANEQYFPRYKLYRTLGKNLVACAPPVHLRKKILNEVWSVVTRFDKPEEYMHVVEIFIEFPAKFCTLNELNIMLGDVRKHIMVDHAYESFQNELKNIITSILEYQSNFAEIFTMDNFMPLVDLLQGELQVQVNKSILQCFCRDPSPTTDTVLINAMFEVGKIVHDSINSMSFEDEIRQISSLIAIFIKKINYGMDLEKQLNFYVECRRAFSNLDSLKNSLVIVATGLAMKTHQVVKGRHTKRTAAFVRACIAFCFITIPSMDKVFPRLYLYLLAGQAALLNQCLPQSESLFEAAVKLVADVPTIEEIDNQVFSTAEPLHQYVSALASQLVVIPGHPEQGPFFLLKDLLQSLETYQWDRNSTARSKIYISLITMLASIVQETLPYHISKIDSNDVLYPGDPAYQQEAQDIIDKLIKLILDDIDLLKNSADISSKRYRAEIAFNLFHTTITHATLNEASCELATKLYSIVKSSNHSALNVPLKNSLFYLSQLPEDPNAEVDYALQLRESLMKL